MRLAVISLASVLFLAGCSETKKEEQKAAASETKSGIEVVANDDAFKEKVKVKAKEDKNNQNYYYDYNNKESVNEDKSYTKMDANLRVRSPYEQVEIELLVHKLSKEFIVKCSACHNDYANGIIGPSLLDKDAEFIAGTIAKYKSGQKENVLMQALVKQMSDEAIQKLAEEIATFNQEIVKLREAKQ
jgi:cytochrome c553